MDFRFPNKMSSKPPMKTAGYAITSMLVLKPRVATTQLSNVVPKLAPRIIANAFFMVNTPAPTKANTISETMELLCNIPVTIAPPATAPILFLVIRCRNSLKFRPERFFNDSSKRYIANRKSPTPAHSFKMRMKISMIS